jgi:hypothetical protein
MPGNFLDCAPVPPRTSVLWHWRIHARGKLPVFSTHPLVAKLIYQLAPAALVSAAGIVLLSSLAKPAFAPPPVVPPPLPALKTEAVFTPTPREPAPVQVAEQPAPQPVPQSPARPVAKPKLQPHKLASVEMPLPRQEPAAATPLPAAPLVAAQPPAAPTTNRTVMARLRDATASVTSIPVRAYSRVAGWFAHEEPPRPPAEVPAADFSATM